MKVSITALAALVLAFAATPALAGEVKLNGSTLDFRAGDGESNDVRIVKGGFLEPYRVTDSGAALVAGAGCERVDDHTAKCGGGVTVIDRVEARTFARADAVVVESDAPAFLDGGTNDDVLVGGTGNDVIHGQRFGTDQDCDGGADRIDGRGGDDLIRGGANMLAPCSGFLAVDVLDGGTGNDVIWGYSGGLGDGLWDGIDVIRGGSGDDELHGEEGDDVLDGGPGRDALDGGAGIDTADYSSRSAGLSVDLAIARGDGESGEDDDVSTENVVGGAGGDSLRGDSADNTLDGRGGRDVLNGGNGADALHGGADDDTITSRDGVLEESVDCGAGLDFAFPDGDDVLTGCEAVDRSGVAVGDARVSESAATASFTLTLHPARPDTVSVGWATTDDTAHAGSDYDVAGGTVTFAPGETAKTVAVPVTDDLLDEQEERFLVRLSNPSGALVADGRGIGTIADDDPTPAISIAPASAAERDAEAGFGSIRFTVSLSNPSASQVTVRYRTLDGDAFEGLDYAAAGGVLSFAPGETSKEIAVNSIDDYEDELDETFAVELYDASNAGIATASASGTILDDDLLYDFEITKTASAERTVVGAEIEYSLVVRELLHGLAASTVTITDRLPVGVGFVRASSNCRYSFGFERTVTCTGAQATIVVRASEAGEVTNSARLTTVLDDENRANDTSSAVTVVEAKSPQTITFAPLPDRTYGDSAFQLVAQASSGLAVTLGAAGDCTLAGGSVTISGAGSCSVTASQPGDERYEAATPVTRTFAIAKAALTIRANDAEKLYGAPLPAFTASYDGFVLGEGPQVVTGTLAFSTPATPTSPVGSYPITPSGVTASNYDLAFVAGTLNIAYGVCPLYDPEQAMPTRSVVAVRLQLCDAAGGNTSSPATVLYARSVDGGPAVNAGNSNPDNVFRYDASLGGSGGYVYNVDTRSLPPGPHTLTLTAGGSSYAYSVRFRTR